MLAWALAWNSSSFLASNVAAVAGSWLKTLMTFCPLTDSSTKALTSPRDCCCLRKKRPERPTITRTTPNSSTENASTNSVTGTDSHSMETSAARAEIEDWNICGNDWLIAWRSVSVSLV